MSVVELSCLSFTMDRDFQLGQFCPQGTLGNVTIDI